MFTFAALPASFGDCLWIEYGADSSPNVILIDAGLSVSAALRERLQQLAARKGKLELVVVTHVDADHIGGMLTLLKDEFYGVPVRDLWFNGFRHLPGAETFGEKQGERLTGLLLDKHVPWNVDFQHSAIMVADPCYPVVDLPGGARITLLSPDADQLGRLKRNWIKVCGEADLYAGVPTETKYFGDDGREAFGQAAPDIGKLASEAFVQDSTEANGSSIAFLIEFEGKRVLCGADAFPSRLLSSLEQLYGAGPHPFALVKLPHHGSENNVSKELVEALDCQLYLFSTNGVRYKHPSQPAVARVIQHAKQPKLIFNYRTEFNEMWDNPLLQAIHGYSVQYSDGPGVTVDLS
ncbi:ComEC/Rec2 family competence protein [Burkholderia pyrrocinia]|uniref:ComEC/Rec2 family competence protein n=1 Tax=Burkholderia pyrrocinia TaxID=60550 RepID=UPI002AAF8097|nr:MBL fold metallo-hydrolase [Burkholderia pyrrocinia]